MMSRSLASLTGAVLIACASLFTAGNAAAQQPTAAAISMAKEVLEVKGALTMFEPIVPGVIETAKNMFVQQNPNLQKDLTEMAATLRAQLAPRSAELREEIAKVYASQFSEAELKDALTFFKSPLGKKLVAEEPRFVEGSLSRAQDWSNRFSEEVINKIRTEMKKKGHNL